MSDQYNDQEQWTPFRHDRLTWAVQRLILVNICAFAAWLLIAPFGQDDLLRFLSFRADRVLGGFLWLPVTYMFLHAGLMHLFGNMLGLFFFGPEVERTLGTRQFIRFYFICGVLALIPHFLLYPLQDHSAQALAFAPIGTIGASGACLGVIVACAVINPEGRVLLFPIPITLTIQGLALIYAALNILGALGGSGGVDALVHLGGMAVGFVYMKITPHLRRLRLRMPKRKKKKPKNKDGEGENGELDATGRAIDDMFDDNIYDFDDEKRRRG
jgi:rhomboid family protein